jgi:anion-transporting  ArsA/GET3 family ATPase
LAVLIRSHETLGDRFKADATRINLVLNQDRLSFAEAFRIKKKLIDIGIRIESVLINKARTDQVPDEVRREFNQQKIDLFPFSSKNLLGYQAINEYIDAHKTIFEQFRR